MFRLHGSPISNYYNVVKLAMLEKGLEFEEVRQAPSQDEGFLAISPMGKIPVLQVREGYLTETAAIVEFLEDVYPEIPLYPRDPFARAQTRRLCQMADLYIDSAARPMLATRLGGPALPEARRAEVRQSLERGARAVARVARPSPWLLGEQFTAADIFLYYCLGLVAPMAEEQLALDLYTLMPGFTEWRDRFAGRQFVDGVDAAHREVFDKFLQALAAKSADSHKE